MDDLIIGKQPDFTRTVLFLDFDGVVNCFDNRIYKDAIHKKVIIKDDNGLQIAYRPHVVDSLRNLNAVWCTSWKSMTQTVLNPLFNYDFGYVNWLYRGFSDNGFYGKQLAIEKLIQMHPECPSLVIADDDFWHGMSVRTGRSMRQRIIIPWEGLSDNELNIILKEMS